MCFGVCGDGGRVREECRRKVEDAMCSKMSLSPSCHVGVRSVCSCLRQMTCSAPRGPPVILHPLSPTDPTDGLPRVRAFVCLRGGVGVRCMLKFRASCLDVLSSWPSRWRYTVPLCERRVFGGAREHGVVCGMPSWEMESGECSGVKALPHWIHRGGETQTLGAK